MVINWLHSRLFSLKGYILLAILLLHVVVLPLLFITITSTHKQSSNEQFISHAREMAGILSDVLSTKNPEIDHESILTIIDSALLGEKILQINIYDGQGVYISSNDNPVSHMPESMDDSVIGDNNDNIYYLTIPVRFTGSKISSYMLHIGFDESVIAETHESLVKSTFYILISYFVLITLFIVAITTLIMRPLKVIRKKSREIANGNTQVPMKLKTRLNDIGLLAQDLETMRLSLTSLAQDMQYKATHDDLTGLPNRYLFMDRLRTTTLISQRQGKNFSLLLIDLNRFKEINDTLGHGFGDKVLTELSSRMSVEIRDSDTLARIGGDEFCIILNDAAQIIAEKIARKLVELITKPIEIDDHNLQVGASIGISVFPSNSDDADVLLKHADIAMYYAKNNQLQIASYHPEMDANNYENLILSNDIRSSIEAGDFEAYFQPKYKLPEKTLCGCELLVRWNHPKIGMIMPDTFIKIVEQENLIGALTKNIATNYLHKFGDIIKRIPEFHISINVSPNNLIDSSLLDEIEAVIRANQFLFNNVYIEVTENAIMKNPYRSAAILDKFIEAGINVSVDDFGTGYSSLAYLQKFPIKELKIDKTFISELSRDSNNYPIVNATITMAHDLDLIVVAEGVESAEILELLIEMGCDRSQGFYHSKPVPFDELCAMITQQTLDTN